MILIFSFCIHFYFYILKSDTFEFSDMDLLLKLIKIPKATPAIICYLTWCPLKDNTCLNKPATFSCRFVKVCVTFKCEPGIKKSNRRTVSFKVQIKLTVNVIIELDTR